MAEKGTTGPPQHWVVGLTKDWFAGGLSAAVGKTVVAPIERVKLILQTQDAHPLIQSGQMARYTGMGNCFSRVVREQGFLSLWRGNVANVIRYFPTQAFNFAFKDFFKSIFPKYNVKTDFWKCLCTQMAAGGFAGAASLVIVYPLDFARTRLAADMGTQTNREFTGLVDCIRKISRREGFFACYKGFVASVHCIIVYRGVYFGVYDVSVDAMQPKSLLAKWGIAQSVTALSGVLAYPFDTVRRRLMMQAGQDQVMYKNTMDCWAKMAKEEGLMSFYKGCWANVIRGAGAALVLVFYDEVKKLIG